MGEPIRITSCPQHYLGHEVVEMVDLIQTWEKDRILPVAGGVLDQTTSFRDARRAFNAAVTACKAQPNG